MTTKPQPRPLLLVVNRLGDVLAHVPRYQFGPVRRLAADAGVAPSTVSRVIRHQINPTFALVARLASAIEKETGLSIDPRDIAAERAAFPTRFVCGLMGCPGCLPEAALLPTGHRHPKYVGVRPGAWVCSAFPHGFPEPPDDVA